MVIPKFFFQYDRLELANMRNASFNKHSYKATAFKKGLRDMRRELKVKKDDDVSGGDMIISLFFRCDQHIVRWGLLSFENKDHAVMKRHKTDVQINDILSLILLSEDKIESDEEEEGDIIVFRSPTRRGRAKVDGNPPVPLIRTRVIITRKRMRTSTSKSTPVTVVQSSPQSGRERSKIATMEVEADAERDDVYFPDADQSVSI